MPRPKRRRRQPKETDWLEESRNLLAAYRDYEIIWHTGMNRCQSVNDVKQFLGPATVELGRHIRALNDALQNEELRRRVRQHHRWPLRSDSAGE